MCRTTTATVAAKPAKRCAMCLASLEHIKFVYLPAKGTVAEPRPRFCSGNCCKVWTDTRKPPARPQSPPPVYNSPYSMLPRNLMNGSR